MSDVIHKHRLSLDEPTPLSLPRDFGVVRVGLQRGLLHVWVRVPVRPAGKTTTVTFRVVGTGDPFDSAAIHHGAVDDGRFIRHVLQV